MNTDLPLDERIAAAFDPGTKSEAVAALIVETDAAAVSAGELAERARDRALDPTISPSGLAEARTQSEDATFNRDRMNAAVARLRQRLAELRDQEDQARRWAAYKAVEAERDQLAEELARLYPGLAKQLADLAQRIRVNDEAIERVNRRRPTGASQLEEAEFVARGLHRHFRHAVPRIATRTKLPAFEFEQLRPYLWPPHG